MRDVPDAQWVGLSHQGRSLVRMPPPPCPSGSVRSAAVVNEDIRELWQRSGGYLSSEDEEAYQRLLVEWAAATRGSARSAA